MVNRWKERRQKLKRKSQKSDPRALRGQERMRKKACAIRAQDIPGRRVHHRSRGGMIKMSRQEIQGRARARMTTGVQDARGTPSGGLASPDNGGGRSPRAGRPVPATYEECPDDLPVEYAERDPYEGLVEGEDYPSMTLQSGYEEELWRQEEEWARKNWRRLFGEDEEAEEN